MIRDASLSTPRLALPGNCHMQQGEEPLPVRLADDLDVRRAAGDAEVVDVGLAASPLAAGFDGDEDRVDVATVAILRPYGGPTLDARRRLHEH